MVLLHFSAALPSASDIGFSEVENDSNLFLSLSILVWRGSRVSDWECCASAGP